MDLCHLFYRQRDYPPKARPIPGKTEVGLLTGYTITFISLGKRGACEVTLSVILQPEPICDYSLGRRGVPEGIALEIANVDHSGVPRPDLRRLCHQQRSIFASRVSYETSDRTRPIGMTFLLLQRRPVLFWSRSPRRRTSRSVHLGMELARSHLYNGIDLQQPHAAKKTPVQVLHLYPEI